MVDYYKPIIDKNGFTHSIDMVELVYDCVDNIESVIEDLRIVKDKWDIKNYWENLELSPCPKYQYWDSHIHFSEMVYVRLGKYIEKFDDDKTKNKKYIRVNMVSVKLNPNKYASSVIVKELLQIFDKHTLGGKVLKSVDYAIDVKAFPDDVVVLRNNKIKGLYKGTRYYGVRNKNGFVRIYNKGLESRLDYNLTRIETVYKLNDRFSSVEFGVVSNLNSNDEQKVNVSTKLLCEMLQELQMLGSDNVDRYLSKMNYRTRKTVMEMMYGNITVYQPDNEILQELLNNVNELFDSRSDECVNKEILTDNDGFLLCSDELLPWEF